MSDVSGTWTITISTLFGTMDGTLELAVDGTKVTGTGRSGDNAITLDEGTLVGDKLTIPLKLTTPMVVNATAEATVTGASLKGKIVGGPMPGIRISGTKA